MAKKKDAADRGDRGRQDHKKDARRLRTMIVGLDDLAEEAPPEDEDYLAEERR